MAGDEEHQVERVQCGVLTRTQAVERYGRARLRRDVRNGRWTELGGGVVVLHNGPLLLPQVLWAALLAAPRGAALGSWSALAFDGMPAPRALPAHVVIPDKARAPRFGGILAGTLVSRSVALGFADVHPTRLPRRTRPARSCLDAAIRAGHPDQARLAVLQGIQAGVTRPEDLRDSLARRAHCRHLAVLRETIEDVEGGIRSLPERRFSALVRAAGLPPPQRQRVVQGADGRYYLDADWAEFGLSAEVHGAHHGLAGQLEQDWARHNALTVAGDRRVLHFSAHDVRIRPRSVAAVLAEAMDLPTRRSPSTGSGAGGQVVRRSSARYIASQPCR